MAVLAFAQYKSGQEAEAADSLKKAKALAAFFDASPSYDESDIRFVDRIEGASVHDDIGSTAMDTIDHVVNSLESEEIAALWKRIKE